MQFNLEATDGLARAGTITTAHSKIKTPIFMPVGTVGSVKSLDAFDMQEILKAKIILGNTYHLYLRPGSSTIKNLGGLHGFTKFKNSFLTDSGGFQAFSLSDISKPDEDGITFKSHIDGSMHRFTPESVIKTQQDFNSDIMMVLDDLVALPSSNERIKLSVERTTRWAKRALELHQKSKENGIGVDQNIFAIIQGGDSKEFRKKSANELCEFDFDGFAIGGLSVGEPNEVMYEITEFTTDFMPQNKPRYLMGVGTPEDLVECIKRGVDMFDCVMPTRNARNGTLFTTFGKVNIKSAKHKNDNSPIDSNCYCYTCQRYSKAYLNHLFRAKELTFFRLASLHNLHYYLFLVNEAREAILGGSFEKFYKDFYSKRLD